MSVYKPASGDVVRTTDGREGRLVGYRLYVGAGESSEQHKIRYPDGESEYLYGHQIAALVEVGVHDYRTGEKRGHCGRCGVRKRDHGTPGTARGTEGTWVTPHGVAP